MFRKAALSELAGEWSGELQKEEVAAEIPAVDGVSGAAVVSAGRHAAGPTRRWSSSKSGKSFCSLDGIPFVRAGRKVPRGSRAGPRLSGPSAGLGGAAGNGNRNPLAAVGLQ